MNEIIKGNSYELVVAFQVAYVQHQLFLLFEGEDNENTIHWEEKMFDIMDEYAELTGESINPPTLLV